MPSDNSTRGLKQVLVVYNPASGTVGDFDRRLGAMVRKFAEEKGYVVNARPITQEMTSAQMLAPIMGPFELVVAVGGDGTVGFVLGAVAESGQKIPVGIVPFGTGNLLARTLKICSGKNNEDPLDQAMDTILHGETISLDLGKMNGSWFTIDAGTGPIADAITKPVKEHKTKFRLLAYGWPLLKSVTHRPLRYELTIDDNEKLNVEASGIFITNSSEMGIGAEGIEHLSDGVLDLLVMNPRSIVDYYRLLARFFRWFILNQDSGHVPYLLRKVKKVHIELIPKQVSRSPLHRFARKTRDFLSGKTHIPKIRFEAETMIDGEPCGTTPCTVEIVPAAVLVRVPRAGRLKTVE
ncbi:MAG TPA: diacylglycerol kinase family protein [Candidatus Melainabacteria bacterium]|nr:diacylglycerol kinase family protein [Candidatus Melainabacteria bacterium]